MGQYTPLQLTAISGMLANQAIKPLPPALTTSINAFNNTAVIADYLNAVNYYIAQPWATASTLLALQSIGNATCPALGDSVPVAYTNLTPVIGPAGLSGLVTQTGNAYLGDGDNSKFAQGFIAVQAYLNTTNQLINSSVNAQTYLGPTFRGMDALVTNNISIINSNFTGFGVDLANQGQLSNLENINLYGTPAGLLQQLAAVADLQGGTLQGVDTQLLAAGLTKTNIKTLINQGPKVTENEFNQYQRFAYQAMTKVVGTDLQAVLDILDVTTPNIKTMADLLNQQKIFPNSWTTMNAPSPTGNVPIYQTNGAVNVGIEPAVNSYLPSATGCEDLGKSIPPDQAIANKAVQISLQQITGLPNTTLPQLAEAVLGTTSNNWNTNRTYLANAVVSTGSPIPTFYRAQQDVPAGVDINDTNYWLPTTLGGLNTMAGLGAVQAQTQPLDPSVISYYTSSIATGSGPNGTITTDDVIGLAIDSNQLSIQFDAATAAINTLNGLGSLNALKATYVSMLSTANDAAMLALIATANANISTIVGLQPALTSALNSAFDNIAASLSSEKNYQNAAGINYFNIQAGIHSSILSFVQNLFQYGRQTQAGGPAYFLNQVADTSTLAGQSLIGCMREGQNNARLSATQLSVDTAPDAAPAVTPVPVVTPVN